MALVIRLCSIQRGVFSPFIAHPYDENRGSAPNIEKNSLELTERGDYCLTQKGLFEKGWEMATITSVILKTIGIL